MAKRLTDVDKWKDAWFVDLSVEGKTLFLFLCDMCDIAGFYERSDRMMLFYLNFNIEALNKATEEISKSVVFKENTYFVKNFIEHQRNIPLNSANNCHKSIIDRLLKRSKCFIEFYPTPVKETLGASQPLPRGYSKYKSNSKGKDKGNIRDLSSIKDFFKNEGYPENEAVNFFNHYESIGWMKGRNKIVNWKNAGHNWITKGKEFNKQPEERKRNEVIC